MIFEKVDKSMKLTVLVDNNTYIDRYFWGEPAVSYYIEEEGKKILFDTGYSETLLHNAKKMNIDLSKVDTIVLSHGHNDHTEGLRYLHEACDTKKMKLIAHPNCFVRKYDQGVYVGAPYTIEEIKEYFDYIPTMDPYKITEHLYYLGQIKRVNDFECKSPVGFEMIGTTKKDDYVFDDSALAFKTENGLFIITGCSHSGICNIIEQAKRVCNDERILGVLGGFHLLKDDIVLDKTIEYFKENKIQELYPAHCVSLQAKIKIGKELPIHEVGVGLEITSL